MAENNSRFSVVLLIDFHHLISLLQGTNGNLLAETQRYGASLGTH